MVLCFTVIFQTSAPWRKYVLRAVVVFLLIFAIFVALNLAVHLAAPNGREEISLTDAWERYHYYYTGAHEKKLALTFDDGPKPEVTLEIANVLKKHDVPATFFFLGVNILMNPDVVRDIRDMGFGIGNHTYTHSKNVHDSKERLAREINATAYLLRTVAGVEPMYYRPPYLLAIGTDPAPNPYTDEDAAVRWALELGYVTVGTDVDFRDWQASTEADILNGALSIPDDAHIVLMHDAELTSSALEEIIMQLKRDGYTFVSLDDVLTPPKLTEFSENLVLGNIDADTRGAVTRLQWFLFRERYLDGYLLTGRFDENTREALTRFQVAAGLFDATASRQARVGEFDDATRAYVNGRVLPEESVTVAKRTNLAAFESSIIESVALVRTFGVAAVTFGLGLVLFKVICLLAILIIRRLVRPLRRRKRGKRHSFVSIIIPAWNEEKNITATLKSLLLNRGIKKEIIVVDDGSTDKTAPLARLVALEHKRADIRIISIENGGKANALNVGIREASADIVVTMDADAIFGEHTLREMLEPFTDENVGAVAGKVYTARFKTFFERMQSVEYLIGQNIEKNALASLNAVGVIPGPIGAWRKRDLIEAGGFSGETLVEDQDMTLTLLSKGKRIVYASKAVAYTEAPSHLNGFLRQRFRWTYGTVQCIWKHKRALLMNVPNTAGYTLAVLNALAYNMVLPLLYPFMDIALVIGILTGGAATVALPALIFTVVDMCYVYLGVRKEKRWKAMIVMVPFIRIVYRQLLFYTMVKSVIRAIEGTGLRWQRMEKLGLAEDLFNAERVPTAS